jgi:hypothetical protein
MMQKLSLLLFFILLFVSLSLAQTPNIGITATLALGEVTAIDTAKNQISLKTKDGDISVLLSATTEFKRVSPEKPTDLSAAVPSSLAELSVGDRIIAQGMVSSDKTTITTKRVILMTKGDMSKRQTVEREKWTVRGVNGRVTLVNFATKEITISMRGLMGDRTAVITANDKTIFKRYAPNSVKYNDAKPGSFSDIKVGDQLRAYGDKSVDGLKLTAEEVVSGSFKMVAGKIAAIDTAKREITIKDVQSKKDVTIMVNDDTLLRKFEPEMAQRMAMFQAMRASGQLPQGMGGGQGGQGQNPMGGGGQGVGRTGEVDDFLERLPVLSLADLKIGDSIAASSTSAESAEKVVAIKFVAGVEPFLNPPQLPNMPQQNRQSSPTLNIPGLDSIGTP